MRKEWFEQWKNAQPAPRERALQEQVELTDISVESWESLYGRDGRMPRREDFERREEFEAASIRQRIYFQLDRYDVGFEALCERFPHTARLEDWRGHYKPR